MSNFKGYINFKIDFLPEFQTHNNTLKYQHGKLSVSGYGLEETFCYQVSEPSSWSWLVCGIGIVESSRFVEKSEWHQIINQHAINLNKLDGHWIIFRWRNNCFEFYNDPFERRKLYWKQESDRIVFSTQLADIIDMIENPQFSFQNYSGFLKFKNSFSNESIINNVKRLGVSGCLKIDNEKVFHNFTHWCIEPNNEEHFDLDKFRSIANIKFPNRSKAVLLLSGGMDSRTVLALQDEIPELLTLGDINNPDTKVAKKIGEILNKKTFYYEYKTPTTTDEKLSVFNAMKKSVLLEYPGLMNYSDILTEMNNKNYWCLDGERGEVIRHGSTRNILFFGQKYIQKNDYISLSKLLYTKQYPCFEKQIEDKMMKWAEYEFISAIESMQKGLNIYDWITLLQIRYRVKNTPLNSQAAHDSIIPSYMPLLQASIVRSLESYPTKKRINNRLNSMIIQSFQPILTKVPLERFGVITPYFFKNSVVLSKSLTTIYKKFKRLPTSYSDLLMYSLKDIVLERIESNNVRSCGWYDIESLTNLANMYYNGDYNDSKFLYNWLHVDFWRERLQNAPIFVGNAFIRSA